MYRTTSNPTRGSPTRRPMGALLVIAVVTLFVATCDDGPAAPESHDTHPVASLLVDPVALDLEVGDAVTLSAIARCAHGVVVDARVAWSSEETSVARVTGSGKVTAAAFGGTIVRATADAKTVEVAVSVAAVGTVVGIEGALVSSPDGAFTLEIPPGAVTEPTDIILEQLADEAFPDAMLVPGTGYQVHPESLQLREQARIRIRYEADDVPWGAIEDRLRVYAEGDRPALWLELAENQIHPAEHEVEAMTGYLGTFAVVPQHFQALGDQGGMVTSADGVSELLVPAGALPEEIEVLISIHRVPDHAYAADPMFIPGTAYEVLPEGIQFRDRARFRVRYDPLNLPPGVVPEQLRIHYWDASQSLWREALENQVRAADHEVEAQIEHLSIFALLAVRY